MSHSELQREYTLAQALIDIAIGSVQDDVAKVERASEWVGRHVAELEAERQPSMAELDRVARYVEHVVSFSGRYSCPSAYTGAQGLLECDRKVLHNGDHSASIPTSTQYGGFVYWNDAEQDGARCPVTTPKTCVREIRHTGDHRSNSGTTWPRIPPMYPRAEHRAGLRQSNAGFEPVPAPEVTQGGQTNTGARPSPRCPSERYGMGCEMAAGHNGVHVNDAEGEKWTDSRAELARRAGMAEVMSWEDQPTAAAFAPDHPAADVRLHSAGESACLGRHRRPDGSLDSHCVRPIGHNGKHMDGVAIAHAGKAGEVWE